MTCIILRPDPQVLFDQLRNMFAATVLGGGKIIPESNEWYVVTNDYAMAEQYYAIADQMWRETNPETACCDNLYKMAAQHGVFPRPASHAEGYAKLTGTPGSNVPTSFEIQTDVGVFVSTGTIPLTIPDAGSAIVRIRALTPGPQSNASGEVTTGTMTTTAPGISTDVIICGGRFCGGAAAEECETFRKRYIERLAYQPRATMAWIKQILMEFPCVTRVCVREGTCCRCEPECGDCGCKNCGNNMNFYAMFDGTFPCGLPPQNVVDDITTWLFGVHQGYGEGQVEIGVCGRVFTAEALMVNVIIDIEGCPSTAQKQMIDDQIRALFARICPSMPLRSKQIELLIASVLGAEVNASARFTVVGYEDNTIPYPRDKVFMDHCSLEPECDILPCLNEITYTQPTLLSQPC